MFGIEVIYKEFSKQKGSCWNRFTEISGAEYELRQKALKQWQSSREDVIALLKEKELL
jgi:hypothetical protein